MLVRTFMWRTRFNTVLQPMLLQSCSFSFSLNLSPNSISKSYDIKPKAPSFPSPWHINNNLVKQVRLYHCGEQLYSKSKDKKGKNSKQIHSHVTDEELSEVVDIGKYREDIQAIMDHLKEDFVNNLSVRTSLGSLESLLVDFEGSRYHLSEVAQVIRKNPSLVVINASEFPQAVNNIKKSICESGMNLNPQQEGTTIYVPVPKVTKEYREGLAKNAKTLCNQCKETIRDTQNKYIKKMRNKNGTVSEDLVHKAQMKVREIAQEASNQVETMMKNKQNELLRVNK